MSDLQENFHPDSPDSLKYIIIQGPAFRERALERLRFVKKSDLFVPASDTDDNILQLAATFHGDVEVMTQLVTLCPELLTQQKEGDCEGQNVLHILVSNENLQGAKAILKHPSLTESCRQQLLEGQAVGPRFAGTVLMGQLPLSVAALTLNLEMVDLLLGHGAKLQEVNSHGDTLLHSLIHFAHRCPIKEPEVATMMRKIHTRLQDPETASSTQAEPRCVWLIENNQGLTALRLAAALPVPSLFLLILELEGVYCHLDRRDGLFDSLLYDVTEIDPVAQQQRRKRNRPRPQHKGVAPFNADGEPFPAHLKPGCCPGKNTPSPSAMKKPDDGGRYVSVLQIIFEIGRVEAFKMISSNVIEKIIQAKWRHYRWLYWLWAISHLLLMILLTIHAVYKATLIKKAEEDALSTSTTTTTVPPTSLSTIISATHQVKTASSPLTLKTEEVFVCVMAAVGFVVSLLMLVMEAVRRFIWEMHFYLRLIHVNGLYRGQILILALAVIFDSLWYWIYGPVSNVSLILALLVGWWFCTFFLRPWRRFSFFTVMLQEVLLGDMLRFSIFILLELVAFSVAMYIVFLATPGEPPKEFQNPGMAFLTMFKLMLGLGDVEVLGEASQSWLSTLLFVVFVVLSYVLMLNALIAMMANTCSLVSQDKARQWELQRLSVVLLLESMLPWRRLLFNLGQPHPVARYDLKKKKMVQETRHFFKVTTYKERPGAAILKRNPTMQTQSFDSLNAPLTSVGNVTFSTDRTMTIPGSVMTATHNASNMAHRDLLMSFAHQQKWLSSLGHGNLESASSTENASHNHSDQQTGEIQAQNNVISSRDRRSSATQNVLRKTTARTVKKGTVSISRQPGKVQFEMPPPEVYTITTPISQE